MINFDHEILKIWLFYPTQKIAQFDPNYDSGTKIEMHGSGRGTAANWESWFICSEIKFHPSLRHLPYKAYSHDKDDYNWKSYCVQGNKAKNVIRKWTRNVPLLSFRESNKEQLWRKLRNFGCKDAEALSVDAAKLDAINHHFLNNHLNIAQNLASVNNYYGLASFREVNRFELLAALAILIRQEWMAYLLGSWN